MKMSTRPSLPHCPAMRDGYQLFRQQALDEGIAQSGRYDLVVSAVAVDERNDALDAALSRSGIDGLKRWGTVFKGAPSLFAGAVVNPGADDPSRELARMEEKARLGAAFFQTQAVYDAESFETFMRTARGFGAPVLAGMIALKSARMARFLNEKLPGVSVPQSVHLMAIGWESRIPAILAAAGLAR